MLWYLELSGYERVYLPRCKVADTPHIQGEVLIGRHGSSKQLV